MQMKFHCSERFLLESPVIKINTEKLILSPVNLLWCAFYPRTRKQDFLTFSECGLFLNKK